MVPSLAQRSFARESASSHISLLDLCVGEDVKVKNVNRNPHRRTRIGHLSTTVSNNSHRVLMPQRQTYIHDARNMSLHRRTAQQQIQLIVAVPKPPQVLNRSQTRLLIRHRRVHVVLFAI
jgi:hypothetical protein